MNEKGQHLHSEDPPEDEKVLFLSSELIASALEIKPDEIKLLPPQDVRDMIIGRIDEIVTTADELITRIDDLVNDLGIGGEVGYLDPKGRLNEAINYMKENSNPNIITRAVLDGLGISFNQLSPKEQRGIENEMKRYCIPDFDPTDI